MKFILVLILIQLINTLPLIVENDSDDLQYNIDAVEGDMLFDEEEKYDISVRNANIRVRKWDKGVIPFTLDSQSKYNSAEVDRILRTMKKIEEITNGCLRFKPRTTESAYITVRHTTTGCNSYVGRVGTAGQQVSLEKSGCITEGIITHELLHAAGFEHEQNRPGRNNYVNIIWDNIQSGAASQFQEYPSTVVSTLNQPYDINSIMHYRYNAFSKNGLPTITSNVNGVSTLSIGQKSDMSAIDIMKVKLFYGCTV
jgi:hypothetical protein